MAKPPADATSTNEQSRPRRGEITANQSYLATWDVFQKTHKGAGPILLPVSVDIKGGVIARSRIKSDDIAAFQKDFRGEFEQHLSDMKYNIPNYYTVEDYDRIFDAYVTAFASDSKQAPLPPGPLDFYVRHPVWFLFYLPRKNWKFSEPRQFSMDNDTDDMTRNCEKICTFDDNNYLLLINRRRSSPVGLKYHLHVTISQQEAGNTLKTDIIIDPAMNNDPTQP